MARPGEADHGGAAHVEVEVRGASPGELTQWLWDFDAGPIAAVPGETLVAAARTGRVGFGNRTLYKTDAFRDAQPFGTVPVAFSPHGRTGIEPAPFVGAILSDAKAYPRRYASAGMARPEQTQFLIWVPGGK